MIYTVKRIDLHSCKCDFLECVLAQMKFSGVFVICL